VVGSYTGWEKQNTSYTERRKKMGKKELVRNFEVDLFENLYFGYSGGYRKRGEFPAYFHAETEQNEITKDLINEIADRIMSAKKIDCYLHVFSDAHGNQGYLRDIKISDDKKTATFFIFAEIGDVGSRDLKKPKVTYRIKIDGDKIFGKKTEKATYDDEGKDVSQR